MAADIAVVGAGLGGLCCAVALARQGFAVQLLERHDKPGGYAHGFTRKGYRFDASLHHLGGLDDGAMTQGLLRWLGVLDALELERRPRLLRVELPGLDITLPNDPAALLRELGTRFPHQRAGLTSLFRTLRQLKRHVTGPTVDPDFDVPARERLTTTWADRTIGELLAEHIDDPLLATLLGAPWLYLGLPPSRAAASFGACVLGSTWMEGAWRLKGGGAALSRALVERLEALGGRCELRAEVSRILVEDGRVQGVALTDGRRVAAPVVVSGANPWQTYRALLPEGAVPARFLERLERMEPSPSMYALYLGLACPPGALGITEDEHFVLSSASADEAWARMVAGELEATDFSVASYEHADPDAAPPGGGVISMMELTPAADWLQLDRDAYMSRKAAVKERLLAKLCARFPGLAERIVVAELATPRTMWRYTLNHQGAVYGLAQLPQQAGRKRLGNRAPLAGLFLTGAWTWAGGGYEGALVSGLQTADAVLLQHPAPAPLPRGSLVGPSDALPPIPDLEAEALDFPHRVPVRTFREALDTVGRVTPCALLRFLDRGRVEACEACSGDGADRSWLARYTVNVYRIEAELADHPPQGSQLEILTGLRRVSSHRAVFDQRVLDEAGATVLRAGVEVTFQDPELGLVPVPEGFADRPAPQGGPGQGPRPVPFSDLDHFPARQPQRVYYEDTDAQGIVYHVTYLRWCEQLLEGLLGSSGVRARIERLDIRYLEAARFAERLEIRAGARTREGHGAVVDLRMVRLEDQAVVADATLILAFEDEDGAAAPVPRAIAALVVDAG
jgi:all-trans-retinol 13,14-reductase